jgi:aspartyl-tRNA(Asn)/glutamyl-tRNA(Gln) amidotransferase subunit A
MCRTADDCGLVLEAIAGYDPLDESSVKRSFRYRGATSTKRRYRIGVIKGTYERVQPEVKANFEASIDTLKSFADITMDVEFPDFPWGQMVGTIVSAEGASAFVDLIESGKLADLQNPNDRWGGYAGMMVFAVDYLHAMRVRKIAKKAMLEWLSKFDAVIAPTRSTVSYPVNVSFNQAYPGIQSGPSVIGGTNAAGVPAVCVPNGFGQHNLPTSLQFVGKAFDERTLLEIANRYQAATDYHTKRPTAFL